MWLSVKAKHIPKFQCRALPDTGAEMTVIPSNIAKRHRLILDKSLMQQIPEVYAANKEEFCVDGLTKVYLKYNSKSAASLALISPEVSEFLVSWKDLISLVVIPKTFRDLEVRDIDINQSTFVPNAQPSVAALLEEFKDVVKDDPIVKAMKGSPKEI